MDNLRYQGNADEAYHTYRSYQQRVNNYFYENSYEFHTEKEGRKGDMELLYVVQARLCKEANLPNNLNITN